MNNEKDTRIFQGSFLRMGTWQVGAPRHRRPCVCLDYHCHDTPDTSDASLGNATCPARRGCLRVHLLLLQGADWHFRLLLEGHPCGNARMPAGRGRCGFRGSYGGLRQIRERNDARRGGNDHRLDSGADDNCGQI